MDTALIDIVAGARPNFMKVAPIIRALQTHAEAGGALRWRLVHTGQHYDQRMSGDFFRQLGIPAPHVNLEVGSATAARQTADIMVRYEELLLAQPARLCLVVGDVTSTMACAISAQKLHTPVAHVEGGLRSGDWSMPEEINRLVTDSISNWFFTTSEVANCNLRQGGVLPDRIFFVGNTMIDTLLTHRARFSPPDFWAAEGLQAGQYMVMTLHRPANVDDPAVLSRILDIVEAGTQGMPLVFPAHPRTRKTLAQMPRRSGQLRLVEPQPYLEFNYLVQHARGVITDSGGVTEETTVLGIPCMTLRNSTERPETVTLGTNELIGTDPEQLGPALARLMAGQWKKGSIPPLWDGHAGERIVQILDGLLFKPS